MKNQKIITSSFSEITQEIEEYTNDGWTIVQMIAEPVATGSAYSLHGDIAVLIEKEACS